MFSLHISWELRNYKMLKSEEVLWKVSVSFIVFKIKSIIWQTISLDTVTQIINTQDSMLPMHLVIKHLPLSRTLLPHPTVGITFVCMYETWRWKICLQYYLLTKSYWTVRTFTSSKTVWTLHLHIVHTVHVHVMSTNVSTVCWYRQTFVL